MTQRKAAPLSANSTVRAQRGLTIVELMTTMGIAAVVLGVAAPSFGDAVRSNRARGAAQQLSVLLNEARAEALKRNVPVLVCPSTDSASCMVAPAAASWAGTTIVCFDADGNNACDASTEAAPNPIRVRQRVDTSVALTGPAAVIRFNGLGAVNTGLTFSVSTGAAASQKSTITVAGAGTVNVR